MLGRNKIEAQGKVTMVSRSMFKVQLENGSKTIVRLSGKMRKNNIKVVVGDIVTVELSPYDLTRGRIIYRNK